ncbi:MAG: helix-turn-helix domain-containing protein, partial [Litoreibacter sp.]|nr:helix-turn-helix domain-containing protein [Litoreibacter sp.]MCY4333675.1 helix-turn-helix domain-containing protein [Litoreibacter sp.]
HPEITPTSNFHQIRDTTTRIQSARTMLTATDASAAKVAFDCGFSSQSHMSDVFRQKLGRTPGQVRADAY